MTNVLSRLCPRLMAPALALAFLGGSALAGAETAPAIAPDAQNEVAQMGKTLSTGGFSFQIHTIREYVDDNGQPLHIFRKRCGVSTLRFALESNLHSVFPSDDGKTAGVPLAEQD